MWSLETWSLINQFQQSIPSLIKICINKYTPIQFFRNQNLLLNCCKLDKLEANIGFFQQEMMCSKFQQLYLPSSGDICRPNFAFTGCISLSGFNDNLTDACVMRFIHSTSDYHQNLKATFKVFLIVFCSPLFKAPIIWVETIERKKKMLKFCVRGGWE